MQIKNAIRKKLIIGVFMGCLVPYFFGGIYLKSYIEKWLYNNSIEHTNQTLTQVNELVDKALIKDIDKAVSVLASLEQIETSKNAINNYTKFDLETFKYMPLEAEETIESYFKILKDAHEIINFIFLGTENGDYMEFPKFSPSKPYDPRIRPWYMGTIDKNDVVLSEPYKTNVSEELVICFSKRVIHKGKAIGVVGITVNLEELTRNVNSIQIGKSGYILVMNPNQKFIVSPRHPEWILKTPNELNIDAFKNFEMNNSTIFEAVIDGSDKVINVVTSPVSGWHMLSVVDKDEILSKAKEITNILISIYLMTLLIMFAIIYRISRRITDPILGIASVINRMADYDFDFYDNSHIESYSKQKDEIGIIATALSEMHENLIELMNQVNTIDDEIKTVNIENNTKIQLNLSEQNPFMRITTSMNTLLDKVYVYLEKLKASHTDILEKNQLLTSSEEELMAQLEEIDHQREYINFLAFHDPLTNLPNRRKFVEILDQRIQSKQSGAIILLDLDNFKGINDTLGHIFGDRVLEAIAKRLEKFVDPKICVSRFGGDEFLILIECESDFHELDQQVRLIRHLFDEKLDIDDNLIEINFSMGISLFPKDSIDVNQLIMNADLAMYAVKNIGKNGYKYFSVSMMDHQIEKSKIELIIRDAIENDGFMMVYQPQIEVNSGYIASYEALLRLRTLEYSPAEFIKIAEENGSIVKIGRIVTEKVIKQMALWKQSGLSLRPVSINFSANQLQDKTYAQYLHALLEQYDISAHFIEIEITENIFLENKEASLVFLKQLKKMGVKIAIDDFGTGYSSLNYLTFLPVDKVKLDRSLNIKFLEMENIGIMDSLILLVHSLGLTVTAEGIETLDQVKRLKVGKCDFIQGFYFSKPVEAQEVPRIHMNRYTGEGGSLKGEN
ncbi:EAL domain-containing protein [Fusibacter sp. 3D3]|uniref:bifunctional diguanylate cyclase/phosphodiesterase n=1 Tax=Fusibacter sp. 3D3 TaxID=1048380 RepID=UPI0008533E89|nr:EAL domain-containing protein [Fusibacter sp. 3D3]GAU79149.1 diguanylate cyclase/phosphodiesterase [Fusibacter sp. 3D3]